MSSDTIAWRTARAPQHTLHIVPYALVGLHYYHAFFFYHAFLKDFIYLFKTDRERERETETETETETQEEGGPMQGARHGTPSQVSRIAPQAEGSVKPLGHRGCPLSCFFHC